MSVQPNWVRLAIKRNLFVIICRLCVNNFLKTAVYLLSSAQKIILTTGHFEVTLFVFVGRFDLQTSVIHPHMHTLNTTDNRKAFSKIQSPTRTS